MAKRGRKPKIATMSDLDEALLTQIDEAARSYNDESAVSIYRRFGLAQRGIVLDTFRKYVGTLRREIAGERIAANLESIGGAEPPTWEEIDRLARFSALERLRAGDAKVYELVLLSKSRREHDKLELDKEAEKRASEKHDEWRRAAEKRLAQAKIEADAKLSRMAVEKGIPADVTERIKDLYGIKVA